MNTTRFFKIPSYMVDIRRKLRLSSFMDLAQQIAEDDSEAAGCGYNELIRDNNVWILSRMRMVITSMPSFKDSVSLETEHVGTDGPFYVRNYRMSDPEGRLLVKSDSMWAIMNLETRTVVRPDNQSAIPSDLPHRLRLPADAVLEDSMVHTAAYSDIDYNSHVNNVKYMVWAFDALGKVAFERDFVEVNINFNHEVPPFSKVTVERFRCSDEYYVTGSIGDNHAFIASFK